VGEEKVVYCIPVILLQHHVLHFWLLVKGDLLCPFSQDVNQIFEIACPASKKRSILPVFCLGKKTIIIN